MQIYRWVCQWKKFENRLRNDWVIAMSLVSSFFGTRCRLVRMTTAASVHWLQSGRLLELRVLFPIAKLHSSLGGKPVPHVLPFDSCYCSPHLLDLATPMVAVQTAHWLHQGHVHNAPTPVWNHFIVTVTVIVVHHPRTVFVLSVSEHFIFNKLTYLLTYVIVIYVCLCSARSIFRDLFTKVTPDGNGVYVSWSLNSTKSSYDNFTVVYCRAPDFTRCQVHTIHVHVASRRAVFHLAASLFEDSNWWGRDILVIITK